jgi:GTPase SAR1 family protein
MAVKLRRPILVGGVGLSFSLLLLQTLHHSVDQLGEFGVLGIIALGTCLWLFQRQTKNTQIQLDASPLNRATVEKVIAQAEGAVSQLEIEAENHQALGSLRKRIAQLEGELDRQEIHLVVTGGKAVGKTTLIQVLESSWVEHIQPKLCLKETSALFTGTNADLIAETAALEQVISSDLVLFVTNGDLTETEFQTLQQLRVANQRIVLVFNKQDHYLADERATVLLSLRQRMYSTLKLEVVAITASPSPVKVRSHQPDGSVQEWMEQPAPDITQLTQQLTQVLATEAQQLVWASTKRAAITLEAEVKTVLNGVRRDRALPVIEQYQWIAAAAAFANPVPALDLLATAAINAQLVMDLGSIYQQKFSLQQAQTVAGTMGSLMIKLGLVELSSKAIGIVLKSNAITFVAGGAVQGVSAAYLTRLAGLSLIEYFQQQEAAVNSENGLNLHKLSQTLQNVFQQNQQLGFLQGFVKQGVGRLLPSPQP